MAGLHELVRGRRGVGQNFDRHVAIIRAHAGRNARAGINADRKIGALHFAVARDHRPELEAVELVAEHGHANDSAAVTDHHIDGLRRRLGCRHDQVALVFPVGIVGYDDQLPRRNRRNGFLHRVEHIGLHVSLRLSAMEQALAIKSW